ncbi:MAG: 3-oxoacyl-[acyl-carrier-protein] reductase [Candidatus Limnocylindrus sp.]
MFDLTGQSAIVTGGARGIGRAIAVALATAGADVLITYKGNAAAAESAIAAIAATGRKGIALQADAADPDAAATVVARAMQEFGKVDLLVNNAGITRDTLILRMTPEQWREVLDTNLSGAFYMTKAAVKEMLRAKSGRIVNITSVSGQAGNAGQANYSSAKAGMIGLTKATAREVASRGITVNAVAPGFIVTELTADLPEAIKEGVKAQTPLGRFGEPEEIAAAVVFLASKEAGYVTGQVLGVDGGLVMM